MRGVKSWKKLRPRLNHQLACIMNLLKKRRARRDWLYMTPRQMKKMINIKITNPVCLDVPALQQESLHWNFKFLFFTNDKQIYISVMIENKDLLIFDPKV